MPAMLGLPDALRRRGLKVEVVPGWETRSAGSFNPKGAVAHWTAGPRGSTGRPSLNVVVNGRPGLSGPLCNVYGARNGVAVVVAAGRANHAGTGGWRGLVGNSAVFGTEMEGADAADFTQAQRWAYPRIHAAYCDLGGFGPEMNCGHSEWAGPRKTDINGYTTDILRRDIAAVLAGGQTTTITQEDELSAEFEAKAMETLNYLKVVVAAQLDPRPDRDLSNSNGEMAKEMRSFYLTLGSHAAALTALAKGADVDEKALAAALAPTLVPAIMGAVSAKAGLTEGDVEAAIRKVLGGLDGVSS